MFKQAKQLLAKEIHVAGCTDIPEGGFGMARKATLSLKVLQRCQEMAKIHNCVKPWGQRHGNRPSRLNQHQTEDLFAAYMF